MEETSINYRDRLESLILRREKRNPGLANIRFNKWGDKTALKWNYLIMPKKEELLKDWRS